MHLSLRARHGFSLVELSIVLVILGLLVGGVLSGQSLIRAAEIRSIGTDAERFMAATMTFRDKYMATPGDMPNATQFWGIAAGTAGNDTTCFSYGTTHNPGKATCNGNGDGLLAAGESEMYLYWQHLANAGMIEGSYTGAAGPAGIYDALIGTNVPSARLQNAMWSVRYLYLSSSQTTDRFNGTYINTMQVGGKYLQWNDQGILKSEEAWNIDTKMDDGKPGSGRVVAPVSCSNAGGPNIHNADYNMTVTTKCILHFLPESPLAF